MSTSSLIITLTPVFSVSCPPQRPNNAKLMSSGVPMASVYPPPSFATRTTTVQTARTRLPAPNPPAAPVLSSATTRCVCRLCGAATETKTVATGLTRRTVRDSSSTRQRCPAASMSFSVLAGYASTEAGGVMEAWTARIILMSTTAVSWLFWPISSSANLFCSDKSYLLLTLLGNRF